MGPYEIYYAPEVQWNDAKHGHKWVILDKRPNNVFGCFPISSECYRGNCFEVQITHQDFQLTGLHHTSSVHVGSIIELHRDELKPNKKGEFVNQLLSDMISFSGI